MASNIDNIRETPSVFVAIPALFAFNYELFIRERKLIGIGNFE